MSGIPKTRRTPTTLPKRKSIRSWRSVNSPGGPFGWQVASPVKNLEEIPADFSIKSEDLRIKTEAWMFGHLVIFMRELTSPTNKNNVICPSNTGNFPFQDRDERRSGNRMCSKFSQNCPCSIKNTSFFSEKTQNSQAKTVHVRPGRCWRRRLNPGWTVHVLDQVCGWSTDGEFFGGKKGKCVGKMYVLTMGNGTKT